MPWPTPENDPDHMAWDQPEPDDHDRRLSALVAQRLSIDWTTRRQQISVTVQNRVVILAGAVADLEVRQAAAELAWDVPGVFDVCNTMRVANRGRRQR